MKICPTAKIRGNKHAQYHYRVSMDYPYPDHAMLDLPVESPDGVTKLSKVKGCFVQRPAHMVFFEDQDMPPPSKNAKLRESKEIGESCGDKSRQSTIKGKCIGLLEDNNINRFSEGCELLYW